MKARVSAPSRLHFTLIDLNGSLGRIDGGIGLAIKEPRTVVEAEPSDRWSIDPMDPNALEAVRGFSSALALEGSYRLAILSRPPGHVGLGSRTQLYLSLSKAVAMLEGAEVDARAIARVVGRGGTSGIGVAAFERGGFILDSGHTFGKGREKERFLPSSASKAPPPKVALRLDFPEGWRLVIAIPNVKRGAHGPREIEVFERYCPIRLRDVERLSHIILMKLIPSILDRDIEGFGWAIKEIQGIGFKRIEVGLQHRSVRELMKRLDRWGSYGSGMSSFGPTIYSITDSEPLARDLARRAIEFLDERGIGGRVLITGADNVGAETNLI